jgi:UDP-glucuronate decarboxylase
MTPTGDFPGLQGLGAERLKQDTSRIVVVGAGGWLGLATIELLHGLLGEQFSKRVVCFGSSQRTLNLRYGLTVLQQPLDGLRHLPAYPSLVLHLAFLTQEKAKVMPEAAYVAANTAISSEVLGSLDGIGAQGVFLPSSGAVYLVDQPGAEPSKQVYGRLKLEDEACFGAWAERAGKRAVIARVFNLSGPYINKQSSYALACFIADALADRPIEIKAARPVLRSYVAISELMSVVFGSLTDAKPGVTRFDTAGDRLYEMSEIAEVVREALDSHWNVERCALSNDPPDRYVGDGATLKRLGQNFGVESVQFPIQVTETARFMARCPDDVDSARASIDPNWIGR